MTLQEYTDNLPTDKQFKLAVRLSKLTLPIWDSYVDKKTLTYRDTVVGMTHSVDRKLLSETIKAVENSLMTNSVNDVLIEIRKQYDDPIVALQDIDWDLPYEVQTTFYSVYNLLEAFLGKTQTSFGESTIYISINQAADVLTVTKMLTAEEINSILNEVKIDN